jgi:hypothetical protein
MKRMENKTIPVTGIGGLYVREMSSLLHILDNLHIDGGEVSLTRRPTAPIRPETFVVVISVRG